VIVYEDIVWHFSANARPCKIITSAASKQFLSSFSEKDCKRHRQLQKLSMQTFFDIHK